MASGGVKRTTALVGYAVVPNAREVLCGLYTKTLSALQKLPKEAAYRRNTERIVQQRLQIVQSETHVPAIEDKIGCGQVEELIDQANRELELVGKMEEWRPWEQPIADPPPGQWSWP
ncbi:PREDICTED: NADH dehydrogenase [ubiquinone] 1 alpha subcomplex subunit 5-like [Amphimedon queenslandica]|uniref:NADH dehydrogenase [ubiquinone] 1 alpha subcomplex subunit 5 n=1 Tax=Amphimedon queenslandica TaxID=400682 RepID=A0A1X7VVA8_AMPQE|nr:PREDICTED: NADH dehydrogenase [ubiquinone] 1 alpha subcomplex subunit 5-like [Amphimedon queenslandica]|eukprot:XP_003382647.1 PREDICTED: NADH dehydrogenase [ubiquinone] 1 alpha subcomplex subunit 5-like [Amphimedon queenslandica]